MYTLPMKECPIANVISFLGDHVSVLIIRDVAINPRRFTDFTQSLPHISTRTLSKKLNALEQIGIISKTQYKEYPPRTEYALTEKGVHILPILDAMRNYGETYFSS